MMNSVLSKARSVAFVAFSSMVLFACKKEGLTGTETNGTLLRDFINDSNYSYLGAGYDALGNYADFAYVKSSPLNMKALIANNSALVSVFNGSGQSDDTYIGNNAYSYSQDIQRKINMSLGFSAFKTTASYSFSQKDTSYNQMAYASIVRKYTNYNYQLLNDSSVLVPYLIPAFKNALLTQTPAQIVATYGTHIITGFLSGGKFTNIVRASTSYENSVVAAQYALSLTFPKLGIGGSTSFDQTVVTNIKNSSNMFTMRLDAVGGVPTSNMGNTQIDFDATGNAIPTKNLDLAQWQASINTNNQIIVDFTSNGLMPIYKLAAGYPIYSQLKSYIDGMMNAQVIYAPSPYTNTGGQVLNVIGIRMKGVDHYSSRMDHVIIPSSDNLIMQRGQDIFSKNGQAKFTFQTDGNLVVRKVAGDVFLWASNTYDRLFAKRATKLYFRKGTLILTDDQGNLVWSTDSYVNNTNSWYGLTVDNMELHFQNDGNLVIQLPDANNRIFTGIATSTDGYFNVVNNVSPHMGLFK